MWRFIVPVVFSLTTVKASNDYYCTRSCPPFWTSFGRSCYRYFGHPRTWIEAEEVCKGFAGTRALGHLVSIVSDDENSFITQLVTNSRTVEVREVHESCPARQKATDGVVNIIPEHGEDQQADVPQERVDEGSEEEQISSHKKLPPQIVDTGIEQTLTWIGLSDLNRKGEFRWSDGTKLSFTNWIGQQNIDNPENRDTRDYKGKKYEKDADDRREKRSVNNQSPQPAGNSCAHIIPAGNAVGSQRTWETRTCNDTTVSSPFVCRILWT